MAKPRVLLSWPFEFDYNVLREALPEASFQYCSLSDGRILEAVREAEIWVAGGPPVKPEQLDAAKNLRWLQLFGAGLPPGVFGKKYADRGITLTNASGVNVANLAEHVMMFILAFARGLPTLMERQRNQHFEPIPTINSPTRFEAGGKTLGILGYGAIGKALAVRAKAMEMTVWAMRRSPSEADLDEVDRMFKPDALLEMLAGCDHVAVTLPLNQSTRGLIGAAEINQMKDGAYIYNIGRGPIIQTGPLLEALNSGKLAGAGLDVTDPEPIPKNHPLWTAKNTILTAHTSGNTPEFFDRTLRFIADNMRRYQAGKPLANQVPLDNIGYN